MSFVRLEKKDQIAILTMDRPPANAFNLDMYRDMKAAFTQVDTDDSIRVAIIRAEGRFFSAGNDVGDFDAGTVDTDYGVVVEAGLGAVINSKKPVISVVEGAAVGSGFCVASYSDIVLATPKAKFGITEIKVGVIGGAPEASFSLPPKIVRYMALTGNLLSAEQAAAYGMVLKVCEPEVIMDEALALAEVMLGNPPISMGFMKESLYNIYRPDELAKKIDFDGAKSEVSMVTEDFREAARAFMEKRKPVYKGR